MRDQRKSGYFDIKNMIWYNNETGRFVFIDAQFATFNITEDDFKKLQSKNGTNSSDVMKLTAWDTVMPLINGYARIMTFSQMNSADPATL